MEKKAELIRERGQKQYGKEGKNNTKKANMMNTGKEPAESPAIFP